MDYLLFLDESGDLGWILDKQYRNGGSSRYLTMAFMFLPTEYKNHPKNVIRFLYRTYGWRHEKKAQSATISQKYLFCKEASNLLKTKIEIKIDVITVNKENVKEHIRQDPNKLYNYMAGLVIPQYTETINTITFIPDERTVKVKSGNSLIDYLKIKIWLEAKHNTVLINNPQRSHESYNLQFVDWIAHCIWSKYEKNKTEFYNILYPYINTRELYFTT